MHLHSIWMLQVWIFFQVTSLKRLDSTKRIRKEIWRKRSDFLGIEGSNDDSYLEPGTCMVIIITWFLQLMYAYSACLPFKWKWPSSVNHMPQNFYLKNAEMNHKIKVSCVYHSHQGIATCECCIKRVTHVRSYILCNMRFCSLKTVYISQKSEIHITTVHYFGNEQSTFQLILYIFCYVYDRNASQINLRKNISK